MKLSTELFCLTLVATATLLMWIPYILARGIAEAKHARQQAHQTGQRTTTGNAPEAILPAWAQRAKRAHANAIENIAVFAPLVLVAAIMGISTPATVFAAKLYVGARLVHYLVYTFGIPAVRTLAFLTGFAATMTFAVAIFHHAV